MHLDENQFQRQAGYSTAIHFLSILEAQGIISKEDFKKAKGIMVEKYKPLIQLNS